MNTAMVEAIFGVVCFTTGFILGKLDGDDSPPTSHRWEGFN